MNLQTSLSISDFKMIIEQKRYFIDKSLFIRDVVYGAGAILFARPRRFGKSLNMTMLRYFYEVDEGKNRHLFNGLAVSQDEVCMEKQGKHPVIFLSFKDVKKTSWEEMLAHLTAILQEEIKRHAYLLESGKIKEDEKKRLTNLMEGTASKLEYSDSLKFLSHLLARHHGTNTVILIDEYDSPIHVAWLNGFFPTPSLSSGTC